MKKLISFLSWSVILGTLCLSGGCKEENPGAYTNDPAIYFTRDTTIKYSFFKTAGHYDTVYFEVQTMGMPADYDRAFAVYQSNTDDPKAAVAGKHYIPLDGDVMEQYLKVPAGKVLDSIPLILIRDESLETGLYVIDLKLEENSHFRLTPAGKNKTTITLTAMVTKPSTWEDSWSRYFGTWGAEKMKFLILATGWPDFEVVPKDQTYIQSMESEARQKLLEYNQENPENPLAEANGTLVDFDK